MKYFWSRRDFLFQSGGGISGLALAYLLHKDGLLAAESDACNNAPLGGNPYARKPPHFKPRAKAVPLYELRWCPIVSKPEKLRKSRR